MSRRRRAYKRPLVEDPKYHSTLVTRLVNTVMQRGKKSVAQGIVYGAFDQISEKNPNSSPLEVLQRAVDNAKPRLEVKARRVGGATYQVPLEVPLDRQLALAMRWLVDLRRCPQRHPHAAGPGSRNNGRVSRAGECYSQTRRCSQDGPSQQGICSFSLVGNFNQRTPRSM